VAQEAVVGFPVSVAPEAVARAPSSCKLQQ